MRHRYAILVHARESDDRMMRLAAPAHDFGIIDRNHGLPVADERIADACRAAAESRELHVLLLQGSVGEKFRHACPEFVFTATIGKSDAGRQDELTPWLRAAHDQLFDRRRALSSSRKLAGRARAVHGFARLEGGTHDHHRVRT
jgi:hypothetical protein